MKPIDQRYNIVLLTDYSSPLYLQKTLGTYKVACELRNAGFDVQVVDHLHIFSVEEIKQILKKLVNQNTLFVGVNSFMYFNVENLLPANGDTALDGGFLFGPKELGSIIPHGLKYNAEIIDCIKTINTKCKIVLGGPDAQDLGYTKDYDYVIRGYADLSIINLANHLAFDQPLNKSMKSIWGPIVINDIKAEGYEFTDRPMWYHDNDIILPNEALYTEISRGCIFKCKFCSYPLNGKSKNDYIKLQEILYQEFLANYKKSGITRYLFCDDTFNDSPEKVNMIYEISQRLPFRLEWWAYIRLDLLAAHPETIQPLFASGCRACYFGIETLYEPTGKIIGKGGNRNKLIDTIKTIKDQFGDTVVLNGSFIFGLPGEPLSSMKETASQLLSNSTGLDSYFIRPLFINSYISEFSSDIDRNYEKYGYKNHGFVYRHMIDWSNEHTSFKEVEKLANDFNFQSNVQGKSVTGGEVFNIAGLGTNIEFSINKKTNEFDWHAVDLMKQQRAKEFKRKLFDLLDIDVPIIIPYLGKI
jgi:radical SAM superfamily enzyme YgiQ (UPF0313 family)